VAELFANVEINRQSIWPRLGRILAGSIIFHMIVALAVLYVPGLRDALYIASLYSGADYVSRDYKKTVVGERATIIDLAHDRFTYPEGYFMMTNGEMLTPATSVVPPAPVPDVQIISMAQPEPRPPRVRSSWTGRPQASPTPAASPSASASPLASPKPSPLIASASPSPTPEPASDEEAQHRLEQAASANGVELFPQINTKPFSDLLDEIKQMQDRGEINLSGAIEVTIESDINADGTLANPVVTQQSGDAHLVEVAKKAVSTLSDSGLLKPLKEFKHITLKLVANETDVSVSLTSEATSEEMAARLSSGFNTMLGIAAWKKKGHDEEIFFKSTNVTSSGRQIVVNFKMPRTDFGAKMAKLSKKPTS